ncbi:surface-adhesin E family protein [Sphingomicrobium sediminis]|uniref:Surface-adhesin protein E-like domain-containing protein n=1 Tax=Sphingomicrobium sediminis TaxID=2950949 RepID=A0A9X2J317_9SPHN|nr:surface-adhesin E family protein [Sphingomicrobium sediminis]MCM8558354.1 hypothetical protein [Sphingomicrobium sediminis]
MKRIMGVAMVMAGLMAAAPAQAQDYWLSNSSDEGAIFVDLESIRSVDGVIEVQVHAVYPREMAETGVNVHSALMAIDCSGARRYATRNAQLYDRNGNPLGPTRYTDGLQWKPVVEGKMAEPLAQTTCEAAAGRANPYGLEAPDRLTTLIDIVGSAAAGEDLGNLVAALEQ